MSRRNVGFHVESASYTDGKVIPMDADNVSPDMVACRDTGMHEVTWSEWRLGPKNSIRNCHCCLSLRSCLWRSVPTQALNGGRGTFIRIAAKAAICLSLLDLAIWFISPGKLGIHSIRSAVNECANNLRAVEKAKQEWAMSNAVSNGTELRWEQISSAFPKGLPVCPEGGKYELGKVGEPVTCSNPNHKIASQ